MFRRFLSRCGARRSSPKRAHRRARPLGSRGFSIVEAVVAMVVIATVTAAAISIVLSSLRTAEKTAERERAEYFSADTVEAFRVSENDAAFEDIMQFAGYTLTKTADGYIYEFESGYTGEIRADYSAARPALEVWVLDEDGDEITRHAFTKGGGA